MGGGEQGRRQGKGFCFPFALILLKDDDSLDEGGGGAGGMKGVDSGKIFSRADGIFLHCALGLCP